MKESRTRKEITRGGRRGNEVKKGKEKMRFKERRVREGWRRDRKII